MKKVENGLFVSVDYKGTLQNGDVFDTSNERQPLEIKVGGGQLITGLENELLGMSLNERKTFTLEPEDAYGQRNEDLKRDIPRTDIPPELNPSVGMMVDLQPRKGSRFQPKLFIWMKKN